MLAYMRVRVGTSGFSYAFWRNSFYPPNLPPAKMLPFYASRFDVVEINSSFYGAPTTSTLDRWAEEVPPQFRFALKAPRRITHQAKLKGTAEQVQRFVDATARLGQTRGPLLFQLPPSLRADVGLLRELLDVLPAGVPAALEFRHASWITDEVLTLLADHHQALCVADTDAAPAEVLPATAGWGYVRLRREWYDGAALHRWAERLQAGPWEELFVFFKHASEAPLLASQFLAACSAVGMQAQPEAPSGF